MPIKPSTIPSSAVSAPIRQLVDLFAEHLPDVSFPDVDAPGLEGLLQAAETSARALAEAEANVAAARTAHAQAQAELARTAERGHGYARVYAADDEALTAMLADISLGRRAGKASAPKVKRKPKRSKPPAQGATPLPFTGSGAA